MQELFHQLTHSLNGLRLLVSLVTVAIAALLLYLTWMLVQQHDLSEAEIDSRLHQATLHAKAVALSGLLSRYQQTTTQIASLPAAADQLQFGDQQAQEQWALESRRFLNDSLGMALIQADGTVGGDPARLRMGPECVDDLKRALAGEQLARPLLHRDVKGFEHIDVIAPIHAGDGGASGGPLQGYLLVSFHLSVLTDWLDAMTDAGYRLTLSAETGEQIAVTDRLLAQAGEGQLEILTEAIPDTRLSLNLTRPLIVVSGFFERLSTLLILGLLVLVALPVMASMRFWTLVKADFCTLHKQLDEIGRGVASPQRPERTTLLDMQPIADDLYALVARIGRQQSDLSHQSMHDHLTGLPNRRYIDEELLRICAQAQRGVGHSVMLVDLDHFKAVNDTLGHDAGDAVLTCFSDCLQQTLRAGDFSGRWAGDEFILISQQSLLQPEAGDGEVDRMVERLRDCFARQQQDVLKDSGIAVTLSIGRVTLGSGTNCDTEELVLRADEALYQAKNNGRNTLVDYRVVNSTPA